MRPLLLQNFPYSYLTLTHFYSYKFLLNTPTILRAFALDLFPFYPPEILTHLLDNSHILVHNFLLSFLESHVLLLVHYLFLFYYFFLALVDSISSYSFFHLQLFLLKKLKCLHDMTLVYFLNLKNLMLYSLPRSTYIYINLN